MCVKSQCVEDEEAHVRRESASDLDELQLLLLERSRERLKRKVLDAVLLHRFEHFGDGKSTVWSHLRMQQVQGQIGRIGCSIYSPSELLVLLRDPDVRLTQLPFNILDRRWLSADVQQAIADMAAQRGCDLIVMASHGRHGLDALIHGSLTKSVLAHSQVPLLVLH